MMGPGWWEVRRSLHGSHPPPLPWRRWTRVLSRVLLAACTLAFCPAATAAVFPCQPGGAGAAFDNATCSVLQQLYSATGGDGWSPLVWQLTAPSFSYCDFPGLTCDSGGRFLQLFLAANNLVGSLPPALAQLTQLQTLNVSHNFLGGTVPSGLGSGALLTLDVSRNYLFGVLPTSLANVPSLALVSNLLNGSAPVPGSLCTHACSPTVWPTAFVCGPGNATGSCTSSCPSLPCQPSCPVFPLAAADTARVAASCKSAAFACTTCLTYALVPFIAAGVSLNDVQTLGGCLNQNVVQMLGAGALPAVVRQWESCSSNIAVPANVSHCPGALPVSAFAGAAAPCSSPDLACTTCAAALIQPYVLSGWINATNYQAGFSTAAYAIASACTVKHAAALVAANISLIQVAVVQQCWETVHGPAAANGAAANTTATASSLVSGRLATGLGVGLGGGGGLLLLLAVAALWLHQRVPPPPGGDVEAPAKDTTPSMNRGHPAAPQRRSVDHRGALLKAEDIRLFEVLGTGSQGTVVRAEWMGAPVSAKFFSIQLQPDDHSTWLASAPSLLEASAAWATDSSRSGGAAAESLPPLPLPAPFAHAETLPLLQGMESSSTLMRELEVLRELRHPNICAFYGLVIDPPCLVMELAPRGSLHTFLRTPTPQPLLWPGRLAIGAGVAGGVQYLHSQSPPVVHSDLKSANVVLSNDLVPKLCDFGISALLPHVLPPEAQPGPGAKHVLTGTPAFMAPEVAMTLPVASPLAVDVYGVGVILHDLAHTGAPGAPPHHDEWTGMSPMQVLVARHQANFRRPVGAHVPPQLAAIIERCLAVEPAGRPTADVLRGRLSELKATLPTREVRPTDSQHLSEK